MSSGPRSYREFVAKRDVVGQLVESLYLAIHGRNMTLEPLHSRVVLVHEIHELVTTEEDVRPGDRVADLSYIGFFEVSQGGNLRVGDTMRVDGQKVGTLVGFDLTHWPNHFNLVVRAPKRVTGRDLGLGLGAEVRFIAE